MVMMKIDRPEFKKLPTRCFPLPQPTNTVDQATFALLDGDGNGKISKDEWKRAGWTDDRNKLFDADGNGDVSEKEFTETRRYEREFNEKDRNGDGDLSRLEMSGFRPHPFPIDQPWLAKLAGKASEVLGAGKGGEQMGPAKPEEATANDQAADKPADEAVEKAAVKEGKLNPVQVGSIWQNPGFFPQLKDRFSRFDKDNDGKVSKDEYVAGRRGENKFPVVPAGPIYYKQNPLLAVADAQPTLKKALTNGTDSLTLSGND